VWCQDWSIFAGLSGSERVLSVGIKRYVLR
jgi:hypothetical protein